MGCCPVLRFAATHPEIVRSIILYWPIGGARYRIRGHARIAEHLAYVDEHGLAGVVEHVTVLEFLPELKADDVLKRKLASLPNVDVLTEARTTEVLGDGARVTGLRYEDRATGDVHALDVAGVFVQIGLLPNTDWLRGTVDLSKHGEIVVDAKGRTSVPGVFAAGDVTTTPFKQIIIATGDGAKAALGAFDIMTDQIGLATCGEQDCFVIGDPRLAAPLPPPEPEIPIVLDGLTRQTPLVHDTLIGFVSKVRSTLSGKTSTESTAVRPSASVTVSVMRYPVASAKS